MITAFICFSLAILCSIEAIIEKRKKQGLSGYEFLAVLWLIAGMLARMQH